MAPGALGHPHHDSPPPASLLPHQYATEASRYTLLRFTVKRFTHTLRFSISSPQQTAPLPHNAGTWAGHRLANDPGAAHTPPLQILVTHTRYTLFRRLIVAAVLFSALITPLSMRDIISLTAVVPESRLILAARISSLQTVDFECSKDLHLRTLLSP